MIESGYRVKCLAKANAKTANVNTANDKTENDKKWNDKKPEKKANDKKANDKKVNDKKAIANEDENLPRLLARFCALIEDVAVIESGPIMERKGAYVVIRHVKFGLPKKGAKKTSQLQATNNQAKEVSYSEEDIIPVNESPLLNDLNPTSHPPEASLEIENRNIKDPGSRSPPSTNMNIASPPVETENRYKKDLRSRSPPYAEMNVASPSLEPENRYKRDPRNRSLPTEANFPSADQRRVQPQSPYQGRQPQQYPNQGRQPQQYPNQGRQPQQYPDQGRPTQPYPNQGGQAQQYPNQGRPYPGASPNSSGQRSEVFNGSEPNSATEPQQTVVNRYKKAVNPNSSVSNFHGNRGQGR